MLDSCTSLLFIVLSSMNTVHSQFILTVNFINYTNPTGLCAECNTTLDRSSRADQLVPVCCDEQPFRTDNCDNTGDARCDTRFRWAIRPFRASLETRPITMLNSPDPPYFFTPCPDSSTTCPFSEMSTTFGQGNTGFLGVAANPLPVIPRDFTPWTGRVQLLIEPVDSQLPNIIDSLLVNLDNLQLGAAFTEEMTFTGFHNISHMTMSFRVECAPGFCGSDCTTTPLNNFKIAECQRNGDFTCINSGLDPNTRCTSCFDEFDMSTNCTTCLDPHFEPDTNCETCAQPNFDSNESCSQCVPGYDIATNCTQCLPNKDRSTNCTQCLPGWDINSDCTSCLPRRDPATDCSLCLQPDQFTDADCTVCALQGADPLTLCQTCLQPGRDIDHNCGCRLNYDPHTECSSCLPGWDSSYDCAVCLTGRNMSTNCTSCIPGYSGDSCSLTVGSTSEISVTSAIVIGVLGIVILILLATILGMCLKRRKVNSFNVMGSTVIENNRRKRSNTENMEMYHNELYSTAGGIMTVGGRESTVSDNEHRGTGDNGLEQSSNYDYINSDQHPVSP